MTMPLSRSSLVWASASALVLTGVLSSRGSGVQSGVNSIPANASKAMQSCQGCHSSSGPFAGRTNGPTTSLTVSARALNQGQQITVTTGATGGVTGTTGGFLCETTAGTFQAGTGSHINGTGGSITHNNNALRNFTFSYTAPNTVGPVELTSCVLTTNGSGSSGDRFAFSGFDNNATVGTPVRLYVLPTGVTNFGTGCADGYNNVSVLGAASAPTVGNAAFTFNMVGTAPSTFAFLLCGFNPPGFTGLDLGALAGLTGCTGYVASPAVTLSTLTTAGNAMRAEGTAAFPLPLPNMPSLTGLALDVQGVYLDSSITTRAIAVSFSNGLHMVVQ